MLSLGWGLIWTIINLIVLYLLLKKFLIGPILGIMEKERHSSHSSLKMPGQQKERRIS